MKIRYAESINRGNSTIESKPKKPLDFSDVFVYTPAYFDSSQAADLVLPL
jgi:hypothetical protein